MSEKNKGSKFYEKTWFMWLMLILCTPVGLLFMWNFHPEIKKNTKITVSIAYSILFLMVLVVKSNKKADVNSPTNITTKTNSSSINSSYAKSQESKVKLPNFSNMDRNSVEKWCSDNKLKCNIKEEYSDTAKKGAFISQSLAADSYVQEGSRIDVVYSLGKKTPYEYVNALKEAEFYSKNMHMSKKAIYDQLTSEYGGKFEVDAAQYAIDNLIANYKTNALEEAKFYRDNMSMSKKAIYDQLTSEYGGKFTKEEAQYAVDHLND